MKESLKDRHAQFLFRCVCIAILAVLLFVSTNAGVVQFFGCPRYECLEPNTQSTIHPIIRHVIRWERDLQKARHQLFGTPELYTALFWIKRTHLVALRDWYNLNATTMTPLPDATPLPPGTQSRGQLVYPLHALYLYGIGAAVRRDAEKVVEEDFSWATFPDEALLVQSSVVFHGALAMFVAITVAGLPALWHLAHLLSGLLVNALVGREQCDATPTSPTALVVAKLSADKRAALHRRVTFVAAFVGFLFGLVPAFIMDVATVSPSSLAVVLLVWSLYFFARDELTMHPEREFIMEDFKMDHPVLEQGRLRFYALKKTVPRAPIVLAVTCAATACMLQSSCIALAPLLLLWAATSCYQHGFQRVAVMMSDEKTPNQETPMGFSCYRDRLKINEWFAFMSCSVLAVVLACMAPFCYGKMDFMQFIDLFARPSDKHVSALLSVTGAKEMQAECLIEPPQFFRCTRPQPNAWRTLEFLGVPFTRLFTNVATPFAKKKSGPTHNERQLWMDYASIMTLVVLHSVSVMALLLYRTRKPPLTFSAPAAYQSMYAEKQKEYVEYWKKASLKRGQPAAAARKDRAAQKDTQRRPSQTVTCLSREEYVLKQVSMLAWMGIVSVLSTTVFLAFPSYQHFVPVLAPVCVLSIIHKAISFLRRSSPTVFALAWEQPIVPAAESSKSTSASSPSPADATPAATKTPTLTDESLEAVPLTTRWCSTSPAAISEKADFTWMVAVVLALAKSSEVLTFQWFPFHVQAVWVLTAMVVFEMVVSRFWRRVDVVMTWLVFLVQVGGIALMFYASRDYARVTRELPAEASVGDRAGAFVRRFVPFVTSRVVPLTSVKALAPYPTGIVHLNYECTTAIVLLLGAIVHAMLRISRLGMAPEELRFVSIEEEMDVLKQKRE